MDLQVSAVSPGSDILHDTPTMDSQDGLPCVISDFVKASLLQEDHRKYIAANLLKILSLLKSIVLMRQKLQG